VKKVLEVHYAGASCDSPTDSKFTLSLLPRLL